MVRSTSLATDVGGSHNGMTPDPLADFLAAWHELSDEQREWFRREVLAPTVSASPSVSSSGRSVPQSARPWPMREAGAPRRP